MLASLPLMAALAGFIQSPTVDELTSLARVGPESVQAALLDWREGLARYQHLADSAGTAATFGNIGAGFYEANTPDSAEDYLQRSRQLAERIGDYRTLGNAIGTLGAIRMDRGDLRGASEFFSKAAELRKRTGDDRGAAADQNN